MIAKRLQLFACFLQCNYKNSVLSLTHLFLNLASNHVHLTYDTDEFFPIVKIKMP